jgi:hypothetical protein
LFPATGTTADLVAVEIPKSNKRSKLSTGAIAGTVIAGILLLLIIIFGVWWRFLSTSATSRKKSANNSRGGFVKAELDSDETMVLHGRREHESGTSEVDGSSTYSNSDWHQFQKLGVHRSAPAEAHGQSE